MLDKAVSRAEGLNVFPKSALKIRSVVSSTESTFGDLEGAVCLDPALSAQVLKVANSPYFGMSRQIRDLRQALVLIGYEATRDLALSLALLSLAKRETGPAAALWQHSLGSGLVARLLAEASYPEMAGEAFVAGLLHDLGKLVGSLVHERDDDYPWAEVSDPDSLDLEVQRCGFDHAELGAACLEQWNLGPSTCTAIRDHHRPLANPVDTDIGVLTRLVHLANAATHRPDRTMQDWEAELDRLSLSSRLTAEQIALAAAQAPNAAESLGLA